jgi:hypothetical protein
MGQEIAAYFFAFYSFWFFSFFLLVRLLFIFYWKKVYWLDLLLPPLWFSIFYLIVRNNFTGRKAIIGKALLYSSFVSLGLWLIVWLAVWLEKGEK